MKILVANVGKCLRTHRHGCIKRTFFSPRSSVGNAAQTLSRKFCLVLSVLSMVSRFKLKVFSFFLYFLTIFFCFAKYNESRKGKELERCLSWTRVQKCRSAMPLFVLFYRTARHASELGG